MAVPKSHEPDDDETRGAKKRVVDYDKARLVISACIRSACVSMRQYMGQRMGDGGAVRSVPLNSDGVCVPNEPVGINLSSPGETLQAIRELRRREDFDRVTAEFEKYARALEAFVLDWSEVEKFQEMQ